jgi:hypothetical protein
MGMTQDIYEIGSHTYVKIDSKGHEETWTWEITPAAVVALQQFQLTKISAQ